MRITLVRLIRTIRQKRQVGFGILFVVLVVSVVGNALTFFFFERGTQSGLSVADAFWYSVISITTIGYGDFFATSVGARIGTAVFVIVIGLTAFTSAIGIGVDWILEQQQKERTGMGTPGVKNHLLIINFPNERRVRQIIEEYQQDSRYRNAEIVVVTDQIETLPFPHDNVHFVRGSPLEEETYQRASVREAQRAIVLSTGYDDPNSDSVAASIVAILEYLNPEISSVAEVLNASHSLLFGGAKNVSLVYTFRLSSNMMVQESQDPGVNLLTQAITSNAIEGTLVSTRVDSAIDIPKPYKEVAKVLLDSDINLVGVIRGKEVHVKFDSLMLTENDRLVYICSSRFEWPELRKYVG